MKSAISNFFNSGFNRGKEAVMARYLVGLIMAAVMAVILGISTSASAGPCERRCNTSSVTDDELTECLKRCKPEGKRKEPRQAGPTMVSCASANNGAGGEIKSGEECRPCSDLDPKATEVETEDGKAYCAKHCPLYDKAIPLTDWAKNCPSCESKGLLTSNDGKNCVKRTVEHVSAPAVSADVCKDCEGCDFLRCITIWDVILFILIVLICGYLYFKHDNEKVTRKITHDNFEKMKKLLAKAVSEEDLALILAAQRDLIRLSESYSHTSAAKEEAAERKVGIEDQLGELGQEESQLSAALEDAKRSLEDAEKRGSKQVGMADILMLKKERGLTMDEAMEAGTEQQAQYDADHQATIENLKAGVVDVEAALATCNESKIALAATLADAETAFTEAHNALKSVEGNIAAIHQQHPVLAPVPSSSRASGSSS